MYPTSSGDFRDVMIADGDDARAPCMMESSWYRRRFLAGVRKRFSEYVSIFKYIY